MALPTIWSTTAWSRPLNFTTASRRFLNSGEKIRSTASNTASSLHGPLAEAHQGLADLPGARVGGHDEDDVAEVRLLPVVVREGGVVHDLQEHVVDVLVRLLDLVEEQHGVRGLAHRVGEQAAVVVAHVPGRRADEPGHGVLLLVLAHVEAQEAHAEDARRAAGRARSCRRPWGRRTAARPRACPVSPKPARDLRMARTTRSMAWSWPKIWRLQARLEVLAGARARPQETLASGILAMRATTSLDDPRVPRAAGPRRAGPVSAP